MSHTTTKQKGRGGGQGNANLIRRPQPNVSQQNNSRRGDDWVFVNDPGNRQPNRGRGMSDRHPNRGRGMSDRHPNRGRGGFDRNANRGRGNPIDSRNNNFHRGHTKRSHSSSSTSSVHGNGNNQPRQGAADLFLQPIHVNNPIFTDLKERFDSLMPVSKLITSAATSLMQNILSPEAPNVRQPEPPPVRNNLSDDSQTFASISNNIGYGFRDRNNRRSMDHGDVSDVNGSGRNTYSATRQSRGDRSNRESGRRQLSRSPENDDQRSFSNARSPDAANDYRRFRPGSQHFNINRTVANPNQRTLSRAEALQRNQFEYDIKRAECEAKEREKLAKKKEEYLARYKHLDLGHRLGEQYQHDPAGHAPSVEEIRQRQQEQLRLDALLNQHRDDERQEQENKKKEEQRQKWLKKHEHIDAGHRLGHGNTQDADCLLDGESMEEQLMLESLIFNEQAQNSSKNKKKEVKKAEENVNTKERDNVGFSNNNNFNFDAGYLDEASGFDDGFSLEGDVDEMLIKQQEQLLEEARRFKELQRGGSNRGGEDKAKEAEKLDRGQPAAENASKNASPTGSKVVVPNEDVGIAPGKQGTPQQNIDDEEMDIEKEKQRLLAQLAMLMSKPAKTTVPQEAKPAKTTAPQEAKPAKTTVPQEAKPTTTTAPQETGSAKTTAPQEVMSSQTPVPQQPKPVQSSKPPEVLAPIKPASCVLKSPTSGPVLVLRPSEEDLNETLVRRLEVQDEMDRRGTSAIYKPKVEEKPIYSNNRFERKPQAEDTPIMGAIPKQMTPPVPSSKPAAPSTKPVATPTKPAEAAAAIIDYQAEMRAARLRMQQKYEESLKKQQGQAQ